MHLAVGPQREFERIAARLSGIDAKHTALLARIDGHPDRQETQVVGRDLQQRADQPRFAHARLHAQPIGIDNRLVSRLPSRPAVTAFGKIP